MADAIPERALVNRAGGVKVDDLAQEIRRVDGSHTLGAGALAEALMPFLTTEPAAQKKRQKNKPCAYIIHTPKNNYYKTKPDRLKFHPLAQRDLDNGYRQTPLYTRPSEQEVTEAMVKVAAKAVVAEWQKMVAETSPHMSPGDHARAFVSPGNYRLIRAALKAAMEAGR